MKAENKGQIAFSVFLLHALADLHGAYRSLMPSRLLPVGNRRSCRAISFPCYDALHCLWQKNTLSTI